MTLQRVYDQLQQAAQDIDLAQQEMVLIHPLCAYTEAYRKLTEVRNQLGEAIKEVKRIPI